MSPSTEHSGHEGLLDELLHDLTAHEGPTVTTTVAVASWACDALVRAQRTERALSYAIGSLLEFATGGCDTDAELAQTALALVESELGIVRSERSRSHG